MSSLMSPGIGRRPTGHGACSSPARYRPAGDVRHGGRRADREVDPPARRGTYVGDEREGDLMSDVPPPPATRRPAPRRRAGPTPGSGGRAHRRRPAPGGWGRRRPATAGTGHHLRLRRVRRAISRLRRVRRATSRLRRVRRATSRLRRVRRATSRLRRVRRATAGATGTRCPPARCPTTGAVDPGDALLLPARRIPAIVFASQVDGKLPGATTRARWRRRRRRKQWCWISAVGALIAVALYLAAFAASAGRAGRPPTTTSDRPRWSSGRRSARAEGPRPPCRRPDEAGPSGPDAPTLSVSCRSLASRCPACP